MYISDKLVFIELHKTGGTHICGLLEELVGGRQEGKHNRLGDAYKDKFVIGSVRNPWDWYISLWAYGCGGQGGVYSRLKDKVSLNYYHRELPKEMGSNWIKPSQYIRQITSDIGKPVSFWRWCYEDSNDPKRFQRWLCTLLSKERGFDVGEGYAFSDLFPKSGLMTYRFIKLFTGLKKELYTEKKLEDFATLELLWESEQLVNFIIRNELLEKDLIQALAKTGTVLPEKIVSRIESRKRVNASQRREASFYYNQECVDLVAGKEAFIIGQFDYRPPAIKKIGTL